MDISIYRTEIRDLIREIQESRDADKTIGLCDRLQKYGEEMNDDALVGFASFTRGETYYSRNDAPAFYREMMACLGPFERIHEWGYVVMADNMLGIMSLNRGNAPLAMDYYLRAMNTAKKYRLPDLEWIVHMNMGSLYLAVEDYDHALKHLMSGYDYISAHSDSPDYVHNLCAAAVNIGKACMALDRTAEAEQWAKRIRSECAPVLSDRELLPAYCFEARLAAKKGDDAATEEYIQSVSAAADHHILILDVFDDLYEYMRMLEETGRNSAFEAMYALVRPLAEKTTVLDLERRLLELLMAFEKKNGMEAQYMETVVKYADVSIRLHRENNLMVSSMLSLQTNLQDLARINHEVEEQNRSLQRKSETDALTGMHNRFLFNDYWDQAYEDAYRKKSPIAIEILDIDYFKEFNDNYGHQAGDKCIRTVASCIRELEAHGNVFTARYGGDEFVVVYEGYPEEEVSGMAEELKQRITGKHIPHAYSKAEDYVTISQGICWGVPEGYEKAWDFLHSADELLYRVKKTRRNDYRIGGCEVRS